MSELLHHPHFDQVHAVEEDLIAVSGFRVQGSGFRVRGSGCRVQGSGFRVQGSGFRVCHTSPQTPGARGSRRHAAAATSRPRAVRASALACREIMIHSRADMRLLGIRNSNAHDTRPVHQFILLIQRIQTSWSHKNNSLSAVTTSGGARISASLQKENFICKHL